MKYGPYQTDQGRRYYYHTVDSLGLTSYTAWNSLSTAQQSVFIRLAILTRGSVDWQIAQRQAMEHFGITPQEA